MKCCIVSICSYFLNGRSREGAWIEIDVLDFYWPSFAVAPARERGLKYVGMNVPLVVVRRSREGAWIEITKADSDNYSNYSRSREGAWIEIV